METIKEELLRRQAASDEEFNRINNEFLAPKEFVHFLQSLAWDVESFTLWATDVIREGLVHKNRWDT